MLSRLFGKEKSEVKLEDQIKNLKNIGLELSPGFTIEHLLKEFDRKEFEKDPYKLLLAVMGGEVELEDQSSVPLSNKVWHFDTECIEDRGDYVRIANRLCDLSQGLLQITNLKDFVDIDNRQAWISFSLDGQEYKWDLKIENDWVDPGIFSKFAELLNTKSKTQRFIIMVLGQDCIIALAEHDQLQKLNQLRGLDFDYL
ncbi:hypothetical protein [Desulfosporosinus hippei]|uniref:Uncharacterized protein n=1 Tax=Desulfosporosinus hippei DSM 8344 TaxID=1121419 RepID=A0A1G8CFT5_9FIRM|nr:hypothetical protein [Desulfosporosinus hippei]SDH44083.1 hypothetical protein SAMN05443529_11384 [Desulfosporosinus hippei DSM 8344]